MAAYLESAAIEPDELTGWERDACIVYSAASAPRASVRPLAGFEIDIEGRYLPASLADPRSNLSPIREIVIDAQAAMFEEEDSDIAETLAAVLAGRGDQGTGAFSDERIASYTTAEHTARQNFGGLVIGLAQSVGLDRTVSADILSAFLRRDLVQQARDKRGEFGPQNGGWGIFETAAGPVLLSIDTSDEATDGQQVTAVILDQLNAVRGDELRELIAQLHREQSRAQLMRAVTHRLASHAMTLPAQLPEVVRQLAAIEDREQATREQTAVNSYLGLLLKSGSPRLRHQAWNFIHQSLDPIDFDDGGTVFAAFPLAHIANCPAESPDAQQHAARQLEAIHAFRAIDTGSKLQELSQSLAAVLPHIADPTQSTIRSPESLVLMRAELPRSLQASRCLEAIADITDPDEVTVILSNQWPDQFQVLTAFRQWLNEGRDSEPETDVLNAIIQSAAAQIDQDMARNEVSLDEVLHHIKYQMSLRLPRNSEPFPGVIPFNEGGVLIENPDVEAALPILVLATAAQRHQESGDGVELERFHDLQIQWVDRFNRAVTRDGHVLVSTEGRVADHERFMAESGVTQDDIHHAIKVARPREAPITRQEGHVVVRTAIFDSLFIALTLHRRGQIDLASPVFQEFYRNLVHEPDLDLSPLSL